MSDFNIQFEEQDQSITLEFEQIGGGAVKSVNGKTGVVVLDAEDVGAYTKPTGGIPKTDLASAVQTSLGKADSAYQKPSGGIPASDIASGVIPTVDSTLAISGAAADAKKTGDEISDLKDGLNHYVPLVSGTYNTSTGEISPSPSRATSVFRYDISEFDNVNFPDGYEGRFFGLDENGVYRVNSDFASSLSLSNIVSNVPVRYVLFVVRNSNDTTADISANLQAIGNGIILHRLAKTAYNQAVEAESVAIKVRNDGVVFESGTFTGDGITKTANNTRIRTSEIIDLTKIESLEMPSGFELSAYLFDASMAKIKQTGYLTKIAFLTEAPSAKYANVFVRKTDSASSDISAYVQTVNLGVTVKTISTDDNNHAVVLPFSDFVPDLIIYENDDGYTTDFVPQDKYISIENGVTVFMDSDGNDTNDGLSVLTPKKTLESALAISNVQTIIVLEGDYVAGTHYTAGRRVTQPVNIVGIGNVVLDNGNGAPITFARNLYCENIHFKHGNDNTVIWDAYAEDSTAVFYNCEFSDSYALNGVRLFGGTAYMVNCVCHDNAYDGFNYHNKNTWANKTVEISCKSYNNGKIDLTVAEGNTSNATTIHGDCIIVRVNGDYKACHGAIVADQGKYSVNYGCRAGLSTITDSTYETRKANYWATQTVEMWLYGCTSYGSKYDTYHDPNAILHSDRVYPNMI